MRINDVEEERRTSAAGGEEGQHVNQMRRQIKSAVDSKGGPCTPLLGASRFGRSLTACFLEISFCFIPGFAIRRDKLPIAIKIRGQH